MLSIILQAAAGAGLPNWAVLLVLVLLPLGAGFGIGRSVAVPWKLLHVSLRQR